MSGGMTLPWQLACLLATAMATWVGAEFVLESAPNSCGAAAAGSIVIETGALCVGVSPRGYVVAVVDRAAGRSLLPPNSSSLLMDLQTSPGAMALASLNQSAGPNSELLATFRPSGAAAPAGSVRVGVTFAVGAGAGAALTISVSAIECDASLRQWIGAASGATLELVRLPLSLPNAAHFLVGAWAPRGSGVLLMPLDLQVGLPRCLALTG